MAASDWRGIGAVRPLRLITGAPAGVTVRERTMELQPQGRVMCVGRSDSLGGGGIQGDIKAITALGGYATAVVTNVTAGDGVETFDNVELTPTIIVRQMETIITEIGVDCIKMGQLASGEQIDIIANTMERLMPDVPLVLAPVLLKPNGQSRMTTRALATLKRRLIFCAQAISVTVTEAELLTGMEIRDQDAMMHAAFMLLTFGCKAVLVHGAQFGPEGLTDMMATEDDVVILDDAPSQADNFYGAKTALAAAIATSMAQGMDTETGIHRARAYTHKGMKECLRFGDKIGARTLNYAVHADPGAPAA